MFKSGFVAIVGRPNVGKSTLLNKILKTKVSITSNKAQTTRNNVRGILNDENYQIVFTDTPGIHKKKGNFSSLMNDSAWNSMKDCELILFLVEANSEFGIGDKKILEIISKKNIPVFLVVNKIDALKEDDLIKKLSEFNGIEGFDEVFAISAETGKNINILLEEIIKIMPEGPHYFDKETIVDQSTEFYLAELIREQVLHKTKEEVPHGIATLIEEMSFNRKKDLWIINGLIIVEKDSHKRIIVGKAGKMISTISKNSRFQIKKHLKKDVYLEVFVKIEKKWKNEKDIIKLYGYE